MMIFKINSHIKKYFDDFLNGYSLAVTFADWLTDLVFHTDFIALCFFNNNNFSEF